MMMAECSSRRKKKTKQKSILEIVEDDPELKKKFDSWIGFEDVPYDIIFKFLKEVVAIDKLFTKEEWAEAPKAMRRRVGYLSYHYTMRFWLGLPMPSLNETRVKVGLPLINPPKLFTTTEESDVEWKPPSL